MSFVENKFCDMLYGHAKGKNFSVREDMLCAGDFSAGKSVCRVSQALSVSPLFSGPQTLWGGTGVPALCEQPWASRFLLSASSRAPSLGRVPQATPFLSPSHVRASMASTLEAHVKVFIAV